MERKSRNDVVGMRVGPRMGACGVVHGQQLNDAHTRLGSPVNHTPEIAEIAHAATVFGAQRKHGNHHSCSPHRQFLQAHRFAVAHQHLTVAHSLLTSRSVVTFLPTFQLSCLVVHHHIFILQRQRHTIHVHRQHPVEFAHMLHRQVARRIPVTQGRMVPDERHRFAFLQLRCRHAENHRFSEKRHHARFNSRRISFIEKSVQRIIQRTFTPKVGKHEYFLSVGSIAPFHEVPLPTEQSSLLILHLIHISETDDAVLSRFHQHQVECPRFTVERLHHEILFPFASVGGHVVNEDMQSLSPRRIIV